MRHADDRAVVFEPGQSLSDWGQMLDRLSGLMEAAGMTQEAERLKACATCQPQTSCTTCPLNIAVGLTREH